MVILLSLIAFLYIWMIMPQKKKDLSLNFATPLWRNAIIKNDINLEDIYQKENNKNVIVNPIITNL